jgi:riboflavin kinase
LALAYLFKRGASKTFVAISTSELSEKLGISQQAVSKQMIEMEADGMIERKRAGRISSIHLTEKGEETLNRFYLLLKEAVEGSERELIIRGRVFTGMGEGAYYVSLNGYRKQFIEKLGFDPYPGTLNLRLVGQDVTLRKRLEIMDGVIIEGFKDGNRTFGSVKCFKAVVGGKYEGAALIIERTHYGDSVLEVISPYNLREKMSLRDGDVVEVSVDTSYKR